MPAYKVFTESSPRKALRTTNLAVQVTGYETSNDEVMIKGISLESGEEITARLGPSDNKKRPSLEALRDGYKVKGILRKLEPGGIVVLDRAFRPAGNSVFTANWPSVMAYTENDAQSGNVLTAMCTLHAGISVNGHGKRYGFILQHATNPEQHFTGDSPKALRAGVEAFAAANPRCAFTIRVIREEADGTKGVLNIGKVLNNWNSAEKRQRTPHEMAEAVEDVAKKSQADYQNVTFNVVPAVRYSVTSYLLDDEERFKRLMKVAEKFNDQNDTIVAKKICMKLGGEHHEYVNDFKVLDPSGPGLDPAYFAGLVPAHDEAPTDDLNEVPTQPAEQIPPAPSGEEPDDPFAALPEEEDAAPSM